LSGNATGQTARASEAADATSRQHGARPAEVRGGGPAKGFTDLIELDPASLQRAGQKKSRWPGPPSTSSSQGAIGLRQGAEGQSRALSIDRPSSTARATTGSHQGARPAPTTGSPLEKLLSSTRFAQGFKPLQAALDGMGCGPLRPGPRSATTPLLRPGKGQRRRDGWKISHGSGATSRGDLTTKPRDRVPAVLGLQAKANAGSRCDQRAAGRLTLPAAPCAPIAATIIRKRFARLAAWAQLRGPSPVFPAFEPFCGPRPSPNSWEGRCPLGWRNENRVGC